MSESIIGPSELSIADVSKAVGLSREELNFLIQQKLIGTSSFRPSDTSRRRIKFLDSNVVDLLNEAKRISGLGITLPKSIQAIKNKEEILTAVEVISQYSLSGTAGGMAGISFDELGYRMTRTEMFDSDEIDILRLSFNGQYPEAINRGDRLETRQLFYSALRKLGLLQIIARQFNKLGRSENTTPTSQNT